MSATKTAPAQARRLSRGEMRRRAILDAASIVFLEKGYEKASLSEILALSGGSRATIYQLFGNKDGLLEAMLVENCELVLAPLADAAGQDLPPEQVLLAMGQRVAQVLLSPTSLALTRVIISEGRKYPHLVRVFQCQGPDRGERLLADYLIRIARDGGYTVDDPCRQARLFFSMAWTDSLLRLSIGMPDAPTEESILADVALAVRIFLHGIRRCQSEVS